MNKLFITIPGAFLISIIVSTCAITDLATIAAKSGDITGPNWDVDFSLPVLTYTLDLGSYFTVTNIANTTITGIPWTAATNQALDVTTDAVEIDFDSDGDGDFDIYNLISNSGDGAITFSIASDNGTTIAATDFTIKTFTVDDIGYTFGSPTGVDTSEITYTTTDFLNTAGATHNIRNDGGGNQVTISLIIDIAQTVAGTNLNFTFGMDFGSNFSLDGQVNEDIIVYGADGTYNDIPVSTGQMAVKDFSLSIEYDNQLPFALEITGDLKSDSTASSALTDNNGSTPITLSQGTGETGIKTANTDILSEDNPQMLMVVTIPETTSGTVELTNTMDITTKLIISGTGNINTDI